MKAVNFRLDAATEERLGEIIERRLDDPDSGYQEVTRTQIIRDGIALVHDLEVMGISHKSPLDPHAN